MVCSPGTGGTSQTPVVPRGVRKACPGLVTWLPAVTAVSVVLTTEGATFGLEGAFVPKLLRVWFSPLLFLPYDISFLHFIFLDDLLWNLPPSKIHRPSENPTLKVVHGHVTKRGKDQGD